ncbi:hypothetical protein IO99_02430 [Clostridium sulfidigenes]|uniref:Uncharacterized protein n=1 Tax=Clostridium sulfidigenes TaxID=318464 RepID=A0A084JHS7_9CLOT|nr:hypothetical protein [Clostridium sulfidigenes]KEZ88511.1 hypothetical protein IO99_02430 [Clostridium sulfidigenes]
MKHEEIKKLIRNVIDNEFQHIQEYEERNFVDTNKEQTELAEESERLFKQLFESMPKEYQNLLEDYNSAVLHELVNMCRFYFKEGVRAGTTNLEFLKDTEIMEYI